MRAALFYGNREVRVENVPDPPLTAGELLLEVHAVGICGTDAAEYEHGPKMFPVHHRHRVTGHEGPMIPGHEFSGRVVAVGAGVTGFEPGMVVACGAGHSCGVCIQCRRGRTNLCDSYWTVGLQRNGALAQFCSVPPAICFDVAPFGLNEDAAALAQPMSIAVHSMRQGRPLPGDDVIVVGAGGIGAFLTFALAQYGTRTIVVEPDPGRREIAAGLGAAVTIAPAADQTLKTQLDELDATPTVFYEVSGSAAGLHAAIEALPRGGRLVLVGLQERPYEADLRALTLREFEYVGTNAHVASADMPEALRLLALGGIPWWDVAPLALSLDCLVRDGILPMVERRSPRVKTLADPWAPVTRPTRLGASADGRPR